MDSLRGCHMIDHTAPPPRIHLYCHSRYASDASEITPGMFILLLNYGIVTRFSASLISDIECFRFKIITFSSREGRPCFKR